MPQNPGGIVQKAFLAPDFDADGDEPDARVFARQVQSCQFAVMAFDIVHFHKDHRIVDPILDVGVLEVKGDWIRLKQGQIVAQDDLLKAQFAVKAARDGEVLGADERADGFWGMLHFSSFDKYGECLGYVLCCCLKWLSGNLSGSGSFMP
jgi:hypothetical protein